MGLIRTLALLALVSCSVAPESNPVHTARETPTGMGGAVEAPADCAKGCSAPTPDETHPLEEDEGLAHLEGYAKGPLGVATEDLETLLFHREVALRLLDNHPGLLPIDHERFLREELARTRVEVAFRLVDDAGNVHGEAVRIGPLKEKQHVVLNGTGSLKHIEISGKTKRVGLQHLWSRW